MFSLTKIEKVGEKTVIIKYYNQASMSRIMQFRYQVHVMALLQTNLLLVYLFFCERKAVLVQWRSDVNNITFLLVMALSWESHSREIQSKKNSVCENTIGSSVPVIIYYYHTIIIIIIIITLLQFAFICLLAPEPNHGSETLEEFLFNLLDWEGLSQNVCCSQKYGFLWISCRSLLPGIFANIHHLPSPVQGWVFQAFHSLLLKQHNITARIISVKIFIIYSSLT